MNKIIYHWIRLNCDARTAFHMFTVSDLVEKWLATSANIEPELGGSYELFWNPNDRENDCTAGCKITAILPDKLVAFTWKGPKQFKVFMNEADPLTHVFVLFSACNPAATPRADVHLIHTGWRSTPEWEQARLWFSDAWSAALEELQKYIAENAHSISREVSV